MFVGVAVRDGRVPQWQHDAILALRAVQRVHVRVVAVPGRAPRPAPRWAGPGVAPVPIPLDRVDLDACDVVLDLTGGDLVTGAPLGTWSFRLGATRSTVPFAHEVASRAPTVDVALVRRRGGASEVLRRGRFPITMWYPRFVRAVLEEAARWPALAVIAARDGIELVAIDRAPAPVVMARAGGLRFAAALARRLAIGLRDDFFSVDLWNVGFAQGDARRLLAGEPLRVRWLPDPGDRAFLADPFLVERDGKRVLFAESYSYRNRRGRIDALVLDEHDRIAARVRAIEGAAHFSFPQPIEIDGTLYLLPECCARNEAALYRCVRFPDRWERDHVLLPFDAVDTALFAHEGRWWAFCTRASAGASIALYAFYAADPRGSWRPHALNPIVVDVTCARPAGTPFVVDGVLYRSGQDCSVTYGGGLTIARIDELEPAAYRETIVRRVAPAPGRFPHGIHTLGIYGRTIVVDGKRRRLDPRNALHVLRAALARGRRANRPHHSVPDGLDFVESEARVVACDGSCEIAGCGL